jgi:metal-sulfur cluster biosynthetic enzyme
MPSVEDVKAALQTVKDPEIPLSLVDLGLIYDIQAADDNVRITMTLTTPGCGMARQIALSAKQAVIDQTKCSDVLVTVTFDPPWDQSKISPEGRKQLGMG